MFQGTGALAFNATFYLQQNPDVFQAIQTGAFQGSALDHFMQFGQFEGRDPNAFFDTEYYLAENPDVLTAIADPANPSVTSAFQHFVTFGFAEGAVRAPSAQFEGFNPDTYLAANPDLQAAFGNLTGEALDNRLFQHFVEFGVGENRPGSGVLIDNTPGVPGETFAFTVDPDQLTGTANNDTFTGVVGGAAPTFQAGDQANGAGGVDRLNLIALTGAGTVAGTILTNVEQVYARALADVELDATLWEGVEQLWSDRSTADVSYTNVQEAATLGLNNVQGATLSVEFAADAFAAGDTLNIVSNSSTAELIVTGAGTGPSAVSIAVTGENELTSLAAGSVETLTITGNGSLDLVTELTSATTVDASANTGGVDLDFTGNTEDLTVTGGSGDDRFDLGAGFDKNDTVDGGAGFDTVVVAAGNFGGTGAAAPFNALVNIERVEFDGVGDVTLQGKTFTNATITNLLFNNEGDATVLNAGSARTYEFGSDFDGEATFQLKTTATTLNIDLLGDEGTDATGAQVDSLTVAYAAGTAATAVTTLNIDSVGELDAAAPLAPANTNSIGDISIREGSTVVITGDTDLSLGQLVASGGGTADAGFTIDASAFTGDLTIESSELVDVITLGGGEDTVVFAAGTSGTVDATGGVAELVGFDIITDFTAGAGGDVLSTVGGAAGFAAVDAATQDDIDLNAATLLEAFEIATAGVDGDWTAFTFGGETYAAFNADGAVAPVPPAPGTPDSFEDATDFLVQLNGVTVADLTVDNFA